MTSGEESGALARAIVEIERHVGTNGWDQSPRLYALARTADLAEREPALATELEATTAQPEELTPVEQQLPDQSLEDLLASIAWPQTVIGAALALERIVLPPASETDVPDEPTVADQWARKHPERRDVRIVVGVLRDGARASVLRVRGHETDADLIRDPELTPDLADALAETFAP